MASYKRATTESYALDSYQNLLFSIARFHEFTGHFPRNITVVGYEFKRKRFVDLHRAAIRWPLHQFQYVGVDADDEESQSAQQGEVGSSIISISRRCINGSPLTARKWLQSIFSRLVWLSFIPCIKKATTEHTLPVPSLL